MIEDSQRAESDTPDDDGGRQAAIAPSLAEGLAILRRHLRTLSDSPGVYRMVDRKGDALYVGKAKNLKKRVASYTNVNNLSDRHRRMVAETRLLEVVTTHTEVEALLLESNLIKRLRPPYNVLLRDDKSFPYILITGDHEWPRLTKYRGAKSRKGAYYGPFASSGAVNQTLAALQRAFLLRSCSDSVLSSRTRPCLLYQIKRCSAPCVGRIGDADYKALVKQADAFLSGRNQDIQKRLSGHMQQASDAREYETAALFRDRIRALSQILARQDINVRGVEEADVIAAHQDAGQTCIQVFFFRSGRNYGNRSYFPRHDRQHGVSEVMTAFLGQFYDDKTPPPLVMLSHEIDEPALVTEALASRAGRRVELARPRRGAKRKLVDHALSNAQAALARRLSESASQRRLLDGVAQAFGLDAPLERIEVYDNSHISGDKAVGAMIVAGPDGLVKNAYRKFNIKGLKTPGATAPDGAGIKTQPDGAGIKTQPDGAGIKTQPDGAGIKTPPDGAGMDGDAGAGRGTGNGLSHGADGAGYGADGGGITPGDDYGMMREVLTRRFARALKEDPARDRGAWPDLVIIDGGRGQLNASLEVLADLGIDDIDVVGIAKGPDRDAGRERFFLPNREPVSFEPKDPVLYFLQRLRDEAHRFAIGAHRTRRSSAISRSVLDEIPGVGARRKRALLHSFGSAQGVTGAGLADLEAVEGISRTVAKKIYDHFHGGG